MQFTTVSNLFCKGTTFCRHSQGNSQLMFAFTAFRDEIENDRKATNWQKKYNIFCCYTVKYRQFGDFGIIRHY